MTGSPKAGVSSGFRRRGEFALVYVSLQGGGVGSFGPGWLAAAEEGLGPLAFPTPFVRRSNLPLPLVPGMAPGPPGQPPGCGSAQRLALASA